MFFYTFLPEGNFDIDAGDGGGDKSQKSRISRHESTTILISKHIFNNMIYIIFFIYWFIVILSYLFYSGNQQSFHNNRSNIWPHRGGSQRREPQKNFLIIFLKSDLVTKQVFFLRISTIFCMRETVIISNGSRILPCPLGLQNDLKTNIYFLTFFPHFFVIFEIVKISVLFVELCVFFYL